MKFSDDGKLWREGGSFCDEFEVEFRHLRTKIVKREQRSNEIECLKKKAIICSIESVYIFAFPFRNVNWFAIASFEFPTTLISFH